MRTIKFRGKMLENGFWKFGYYYINQWGEHCIYAGDRDFIVIPETVGQFAFITDKKGNEAYFDDIVKIKERKVFRDGTEFVENSDLFWVIRQDDFGIPLFEANAYNDKGVQVVEFLEFFQNFGRHDFEIVGNEHDNMELLKGDDKCEK